jgi:hypothetical protein
MGDALIVHPATACFCAKKNHCGFDQGLVNVLSDFKNIPRKFILSSSYMFLWEIITNHWVMFL